MGKGKGYVNKNVQSIQFLVKKQKIISRKKTKDKLVLDFILCEVNCSLVRESTLYFPYHIFTYKS